MDHTDNIEMQKSPIEGSDYIIVDRDIYPKCYKIKLSDLKSWMLADMKYEFNTFKNSHMAK